MKVLNNLHMMVNGPHIAVGWNELDGNRMHVWLVAEGSHEAGFTPKLPYTVQKDGKGKPTLYRNPPEGVAYRRPGYFDTRYLDAESKAWRTIVAEALDRARHEGLFAKAVAEREAQEANRKREAELKLVDSTREALKGYPFADPNARRNADDLLALDDELLLELAKAFKRA